MFYSRLGAPGFEALEFASGGTSSGINGAGGVKPNDAFVSSTAVGDTYLRGGSRSGSVVSAMSVSGASVPESRTNGQSPATDP